MDGDGAGTPVRKVAISWRSSEPSSGARPTYSTRTLATPFAFEIKEFRGFVRDVDEAVAVVRAAVVDADDQGFAVAEGW